MLGCHGSTRWSWPRTVRATAAIISLLLYMLMTLRFCSIPFKYLNVDTLSWAINCVMGPDMKIAAAVIGRKIQQEVSSCPGAPSRTSFGS